MQGAGPADEVASVGWEKSKAIRLINGRHTGEPGVSLSYYHICHYIFSTFGTIWVPWCHPAFSTTCHQLAAAQLINRTYWIPFTQFLSLMFSYRICTKTGVRNAKKKKTRLCNAHRTICPPIFASIQHPEYRRTKPENGYKT